MKGNVFVRPMTVAMIFTTILTPIVIIGTPIGIIVLMSFTCCKKYCCGYDEEVVDVEKEDVGEEECVEERGMPVQVTECRGIKEIPYVY